jgi:hypothetical protein
MEHFWKKPHLLKAVSFIVVFAAVSAIVMLLWNAISPVISVISVINYWQAAGILLLSRILFGGCGKSGHGGPEKFHKHYCVRSLKRDELNDLHEKIKGMSLRERREFILRKMADWNEEIAENDEKK